MMATRMQGAGPAPGNGALLAHPQFRIVLAVRVCWTLGIQMLLVAVGWHMYDVTGSAWSLGLVGLVQFVPVLLFTLPAGHAADHWSRRRIISVCLLLQFAAALALAAWTFLGTATAALLYAASFALGIARAFQMPALQATTPGTVPPALLSRAMAASSSGTQASVIAGPALGGLVLGAGVHVVYALAAALFAIGAACAHRLHAHRAAGAGAGALPADAVLEGLRFIRRRPVILGAIALDLFAVLFGGAIALLPIYARDLLDGGPSMLGWLRAAPALGALAMSLWLVRRPLKTPIGWSLLASIFAFGLATVVFGLSRHVALSMAALAMTGAADMVSVVIRQTLVQLETPDAMRGRVSAVNSVFIGASNQLGEFESGALAALVGPAGAVVGGGIATCLVALAWPWLFPDLARRRRLDA